MQPCFTFDLWDLFIVVVPFYLTYLVSIVLENIMTLAKINFYKKKPIQTHYGSILNIDIMS